MLQTLLIIHSALVLLLIIVVLLQKSGSGALSGLSGSSGGTGGIFTAQGGKNFMTRLTAILATLFICSSLGLAMLSKREHAPKSGGASIVDEIIKEEQGKGARGKSGAEAVTPDTPTPDAVPSVPLKQ